MISFDRVFREKRSLMLPLLIALAVNMALLVLAVLPLRQSVASEEARAITVAQDRADAQQTFARAQAIVNGKTRADKELARFYGQVLPANQSGATRIMYLNVQQLARAAGLAVSDQSTVLREADEEHGLTEYRTELTLSGSYRGIRQFIYALETQPAFLVIDSLKLAGANDSGDRLQVTMELATFYRMDRGR